MQVNPYLNFAGNAEEAFEFYRSVFGGEFSSVVRFKDMPMEGMTIPDADQEKLMHIALPIGDGHLLMASDRLESLGQGLTNGDNAYISLHPESRDEADRLFSALSDGGEIGMPIADQPWGDYYGDLRDRFGVQWMIIHSQQG